MQRGTQIATTRAHVRPQIPTPLAVTLPFPFTLLPISSQIAKPVPLPFVVGERLADDAYEVLAVLGQGGMGVVYEAFDRLLRRRVAIKTAISRRFAEALRAEAQALATLRSPSFPTVYGLVKHGEDELIVMERLHGEQLDQRLEHVRLHEEASVPLDEVFDILIGIAQALHIAHDGGIAQRDVKPANIMICGKTRIVLFDLGLVVPEILVEPDALISGSADYLAPELLLGELKKGGGPLVDLYALGIVAFELLAGVPPFQSDVLEQTLARHICEPIPDVRSLRPDAPAELAALITSLLAKAPADRPGSAQCVLWELQHVKAQHVRHSQRPPTPTSTSTATATATATTATTATTTDRPPR
jgi:eukaryotic-like serine/threonine-protein kinase